MFNAIIGALVEDKLYEHIKSNLVAFVSDGNKI